MRLSETLDRLRLSMQSVLSLGKSDVAPYETHSTSNPILNYLIAASTLNGEDVSTPQPLHKRMYNFISLCRRNIIMIISQSITKGVVPLITQYYVGLLQTAYLAQLAGGIEAGVAITLFHWSIGYALIAFLAFAIYDGYADLLLEDIHLQPKILNTKVLIQESMGSAKIAEKSDVYKQARLFDNNTSQLSELGSRFSSLTRKTISFFIDFIIFFSLIGPYMLAIALIAMVSIASMSSWISKSDAPLRKDLSQKSSQAQETEHSSREILSEKAVAASKELPGIALSLYYIKVLTGRLKRFCGNIAHPVAILFFSLNVLNGTMDPVTAMVLANTFQKSFIGLLDYPEVILGRQKFETTLDFQLKAIHEQDPSFLVKHYNELNKPYFPTTSKLASLTRAYIYVTTCAVIVGVLLIPTPAIMPIISSYISQQSYQHLILNTASAWLASSAVFGALNSLDYKTEDTTSYFLALGLLIAFTAGTMFYAPILIETYAQTAWTAYMYLGTASAVLATALFDAYCFQHFAFAIDAICIYISQEIVTLLQLPLSMYKVTRDFTSDKAEQSYNYVCSKSFNSAKYVFQGVKGALDRCESFFEAPETKLPPGSSIVI